LENAGLSKFRTLKLYLIRKGNFKSTMTYDIIVPKANKAAQFAPLAEIADKELENMEDESNQLNGEEYQMLLAEIFQSALEDAISRNS